MIHIIASALIILLGAAALVCFGGTARYAAVNGEGIATAAPDRAHLTVGIESEGPTAQATQQAAARVMAKVIAAVRGYGLDAKMLKTVAMTLDPVREYNQKDGREYLRGYRAINRVQLTVIDLRKLGQILDATVAAGANTAGEVSFYLSDAAELHAQALTAALVEAKKKALSLAVASGLSSATAVEISEEQAANAQPMTFMVEKAKLNAGATTPVEPGEVSYHAFVRVKYRMK